MNIKKMVIIYLAVKLIVLKKIMIEIRKMIKMKGKQPLKEAKVNLVVKKVIVVVK